jgi:cell division protein FtsW
MIIEKKSPDLWVFITVIILTAIGVCMVFSSSYVMGYKWYGDSYYFLKKQLFFSIIALVVFFFAIFTDYHHFKKICFTSLNFIYYFAIHIIYSKPWEICWGSKEMD